MNALEDAELLLKLREYSFKGKRIPESMHESIIQYVVYHREPGGFLKALICNDLFNAAMRADCMNLPLLHVFVGFFYNWTSAGCWGSADKYRLWLARGCR